MPILKSQTAALLNFYLVYYHKGIKISIVIFGAWQYKGFGLFRIGREKTEKSREIRSNHVCK